MPLTGFLDGFNEQRLTEQHLQDQQQISQLRAVQAADKLQDMAKERLVQGTLAQIFQGQPSEGADPEVLTRRMEQAGTQIMAVDPKRGLEFISGASLLKQRKALEDDKRLEAEAAKREAIGAALGSATGPENYQEAVNEALQRGWKLPAWYTGDWEQDGPKLAQAARATISAKDQSLVDLRQARETAAAADAKNDAARTALIAARDAEKVRHQAEVTELKKREADRDAAQDRENLRRKRIATERDKDDAFIALEARPDLPSMSKETKREIAARAASRARNAAAESDDDFNAILNKEIDKALKEDLGKPKREPSLLNPLNWFFDNNVPLKGSEEATAPPMALPGTRTPTRPIRGAGEPKAPAKGFPTPSAEALAYLREHPESKAKFKEVYGYVP